MGGREQCTRRRGREDRDAEAMLAQRRHVLDVWHDEHCRHRAPQGLLWYPRQCGATPKAMFAGLMASKRLRNAFEDASSSVCLASVKRTQSSLSCRRSSSSQVASIAATDLIYGNSNAMWQHGATLQPGYVYEFASPAGAFADTTGNVVADAKSSLFRVALELSDFRGTDNADTGTKVTEECLRSLLVATGVTAAPHTMCSLKESGTHLE